MMRKRRRRRKRVKKRKWVSTARRIVIREGALKGYALSLNEVVLGIADINRRSIP